ncbi:hypothetical protein Pcinc_022540 [Petrolisthes cinctipes]|uniref:Separin n=1 Tax=Petrolisthes cinctipes TaxID=88211 RepID=A0AAE1FDW8_PETCI|nr:hypothetical protein Pcinc_022540 [Petrolisthes cinctipes]
MSNQYKMGNLSRILEKIKNGQLNELPPQVQDLSSIERQHVVRHCSHYVHSNPNLDEPAFTSIMDIVVQCLPLQQKDASEEEPEHLFKSMFFIIVTALKRKDLHCYLVKLLNELEPVARRCEMATGELRSYAKSLYQSLWNASFTLTDPLMTLTLHQFSLQYHLASGASVSIVCSQAFKILLSFQESTKSVENLDTFRIHLRILDSIIQMAQKETDLSDELVLHIHRLVMEFAKVLLRLNECASYRKISKDVITLCEKRTHEQILQALKIGLKLTECAMAYKVGRCEADKMKKMVSTSSSVLKALTKNSSPKVLTLNTIVVRSLLTMLTIFTIQQEEEVEYTLEGTMLTYLLETLLSWCNAPINEEDARKVATILYQHVGSFVKMFETTKDQNKNTDEQTRVLKEALLWGTRTKEFYRSHTRHKEDWQGHYYNLGVYTGNVGVLAFRAGNNEMPSKMLELSVNMLVQYQSIVTQQQQLDNVTSVLTKRVKTWSDALRYSGQFREAGVAAAMAVMWGLLSPHELITIWVKCKRDARKINSDAVQGMTVCETVSEAQRRLPEVSHVPFNKVWALKEEIKSYRSQGCNTSSDELACGERLVQESESVMDRAEGLLTVTVALMESNKSADTALKAITNANKAIQLINIAKSENSGSERELLAQAHFWLYLCQLQHAEMTAPQVVVEDIQKPPASLSTQAIDQGDEVQVDDQCDVRPSALTFTLDTQSDSLTPLHTALDIWRELAKKDVTLEYGDRTCSLVASAAYIYQLSGLLSPTVSCWSTLITLARTHNLNTLLVKGVTELLLVAGELVPESLVTEAEVVVESLQHKSVTTQDSSHSYLITALHSAIALHLLKTGQYQRGAQYLTKAIQSDVIGKQTIGATEVKVIVNLVASHYALLPSHLFNEPLPPAIQPAYLHALLACRQGIALIRSATSAVQDGLVCYHHRVAWLHLTTTAWLGRLSLASAQPRVARAYLKASLSIAHQFTLPLWMAELLEVLASVDLMCDQFEDCRVKVERLISILAVHSTNTASSTFPSITKSSTTTSKFTAPIPCSLEAAKSTKVPKCTNLPDVQMIRVDRGWNEEEEEEWMRDKSTAAPEYKVKSVSFNPSLVVIGNEKRLPILANAHLALSPSTEFREDVSVVVGAVECPEGVVECMLCSTPLLHYLLISTANLLAMVHTYAGRYRPATTCLNRASQMYSLVSDKAYEICSQLRSIIGGEMTDSQPMFVESRLNEVRIRLGKSRAELLAVEGKVEEAVVVTLDTLKMISTLPTQLLFQDLQIILVTQLQGVTLEQMVAQQKAHNTPEHNADTSLDNICVDDAKCPDNFSTPVCTRRPAAPYSTHKSVRHTIHKSTRPALKTKCPATPRSLQKTSQRHLTLPATTQWPETKKGVFSIFSDEDESSVRVNRPVTPSTKTYQKSTSKSSSIRKGTTTVSSTMSSTSVVVVKPKAARSLARKKSHKENDMFEAFNITNSPTDVVLEVPRSSRIKTYNKTCSKIKKDYEDVVEKINTAQSKTSKKKINDLDDTSDSQNITDDPFDVVLEVPVSSQRKTYRNSSRQKGGCNNAEKVPESSTRRIGNGTRRNVDREAAAELSTNTAGSVSTSIQAREMRTRGSRTSKPIKIFDTEPNKTSTKVKPPSFGTESDKSESERSRNRSTRSTRILR